jgi:processing peptidase subunit alpha
VVRDVEDMGASVSAVAAREYMMYTANVLRPNVDQAMELLAETVLTPAFEPWDLGEQRRIIDIEREDLEKNAHGLVTEMIYSAAYTDSSPLGRPLFCPARNTHKLGPADLAAFSQEHYTANRMVLAAAGVDHAELVEMAKKYFGNAKPGAAATPKRFAPKYVGGDERLRGESPMTQVVLCFESGGWSSPSLLSVCVLHMLLGGGSSFSPGGPGKGMYSRLYTNLLNKHHWVDSATAFNSMHNDTGLIGIYGTAAPRDVGNLVDVMAAELVDVASRAPNAEETTRAKNQLKSSVFMNLESSAVLMEDLGRQTLVYGKREDPTELCKRIDAVTAAQVQAAAKAALATPVSVAAFGDVSALPSYEVIAKRFK